MIQRLVSMIVLAAALCGIAAADTYVVTLDPEIAGDPQAAGRLILFFVTEEGGRWSRIEPRRGPFFGNPQPIASVPVTGLEPGGRVVVDGDAVAFPASIDALDGPIRVQALLDTDRTERNHNAGPGNLYSDVVSATVSKATDDHVELRLTNRIDRPRAREDSENLKWVELRSETLSAFYGRDVFHRAGVALPPGYDDEAKSEWRWPTVYVVPGFGGRDGGARRYASMFRTAKIEEVAPMAVFVVLDPESPLGHHGFVDSANHGPRGTALTEELIPHLEERFRLVSRPAGRIVTGHSSGGWSSLWLQLRWPDVFGACWASSPDPIDFRAFQMSDLYRDANLYRNGETDDLPSMRAPGPNDTDRVIMTARQEAQMEYAIDPLGGSGEQWDTWEAMFSPANAATGLPRPMFDGRSGAIDRDVVEHWKKYDIGRLVRSDWNRYGPIVMQRVRLACGTRDSFYLDRAVMNFKTDVERLAAENGGWHGDGEIWLVKGATHSLAGKTIPRWNEQMRAYLRLHGLQEE
ncbi:MAG: alpha/beta hydrolase [Planctomycetota bacterium]